MSEKPILFSAPMVRAILAGTKSQTRRVIKAPDLFISSGAVDGFGVMSMANDDIREVCCPYGSPGTRLWVKETWGNGALPGYPPTYFYRADDVHSHREGWATPPGFKWRPSIHMPRAASRITLEVTGVRVERIQDISEADALAEGVALHDDGKFTNYLSPTGYAGNAVSSYRSLWGSINGPGSWSQNPLAWVIEFRRVTS